MTRETAAPADPTKSVACSTPESQAGGSTMQGTVWLLLVVAAVLLAAYMIHRASAPSAVSGSEVWQPAAAAIPVAAPKPQPVKVPSSPAVKASQPQPLVPEVAAKVAPKVAPAVAPAAPEPQPSGDRAPQAEAVFAGADNQFRILVGDALVPEGGLIQGYRVRKVQADSVTFEKDGQIWVQKLD